MDIDFIVGGRGKTVLVWSWENFWDYVKLTMYVLRNHFKCIVACMGMEQSGGKERMPVHRDGMNMEKWREKVLYINILLYFHFHASYLIWALQCFTATLAILDRQSKRSLLLIHPCVAPRFCFQCFSCIQVLYY